MKLIGVIPARYASTRMPGKPLADILGKPMIWWVYQEAKKCKKLDDVFIATDDERIAEACRTYGMEYCMTSPDHDTPTGREALRLNSSSLLRSNSVRVIRFTLR